MIFFISPPFEPWDYAESTFLPLALLADRTLRPFVVLILLRKPCTLEWERFFG